jgi:preprotein translocase subunit SecG
MSALEKKFLCARNREEEAQGAGMQRSTAWVGCVFVSDALALSLLEGRRVRCAGEDLQGRALYRKRGQAPWERKMETGTSCW